MRGENAFNPTEREQFRGIAALQTRRPRIRSPQTPSLRARYDLRPASTHVVSLRVVNAWRGVEVCDVRTVHTGREAVSNMLPGAAVRRQNV